MLVARILKEVDAELDRLQTARDTIAALIASAPKKSRASSIQQQAAQPEGEVLAAEEAITAPDLAAVPEEIKTANQPVTITVVPPRRRGRPKGSVNRKPSVTRVQAGQITRHVAEPTALTRAVITGPVFVSAAELERRRKQAFVMPAPGAVESTLR